MLRVVADDKTSAEMGSGLDELVREGARRMMAAALARPHDTAWATMSPRQRQTKRIGPNA
jgi:hypothetical protein